MTATFTAKDVQELRQRTGAGMMDCKKALEENQGNMEAAVDFLRKKGIAKAEKRAGKTASEGVVVALTNDAAGVIVEVNCETDFVARNQDFQALARQVAEHALATPSATDAESLLASQMNGQDVATFVKESSAKMGELVQVRRIARLDGTVGKYVHFNGKIGVLVAIAGSQSAEARDLGNVLAEHVAAAAPLGITKDTVPADVVERERKVFTDQVREQGKPEAMIEKIVSGKIEAYYRDVALLHQMWVREPKTAISTVVADAGKKAGAELTVTKFVRFQLGQE